MNAYSYRNECMFFDRDCGMTYEQLAKKYGVSRQRVGQICGKYNKKRFHAVTQERCKYINLRIWMNEKHVTMCDLIEMMGVAQTGTRAIEFRSKLAGSGELSKLYIGKLMNVTGLGYDDLLEVG